MFLLWGLLSPAALQADDEETLRLYQELAAEQGGGVVLELEEESESASPPRSRSATGGKQVELIVGGQGENGIAKRGELHIEK